MNTAITPYTIASYRYAKNSMVVRCPSPDGYKTRAARLIGDGLKGRYAGRAHGYVVSPAKAAKFERLYAEGWDASAWDGELRPPMAEFAKPLATVDGRAAFSVFKTHRPLEFWIVIAADRSVTFGELQDGGSLANQAIDLRRYGCAHDYSTPNFEASRLAAINRAMGASA